MAEAVHHVGELGDDGRVDVHRVGKQEGVDVGRDQARELFEHQVLVHHLGAEAGRLEQPFSVPEQTCRVVWHAVHRNQQPLVEKGQVTAGDQLVLDLFDPGVVFAVEHVVHRGQSDVFVAAAVADDEVLVQQFVVIGGGDTKPVERDRIASVAVRVGRGDHGSGGRVAVVVDHAGRCAVSDVVEEGAAGTNG
ncbi:hypothetical protein D9M68_679480 [compost metagenome]